jgi:hypothetical protein
MPYLVMTLRNYRPLEYYEKLIEIYSAANSWKLLGARVGSTPDYSLKALYFLRAMAFTGILGKLTRTRDRLRDDEEFRSFHEGRTSRLPTYYRHLYARRLGRYAELISEADRTPELEMPAAPAVRPVARPGVAAPLVPVLPLVPSEAGRSG